MGKNAFVTLATCDDYALSALCLAQSIRNVGTEADLVILITTGISENMRTALKSLFTKLQEVTELNSNNTEILQLINRPELSVTITKINAWQLTDYEKCVFIDADCLLLKPVDELFERPELSAVCDLGWPDCFNSGVFVFKPSLDTYNDLVNLVKTEDSFDGGDQGLLNIYFSNWLDSDIKKRLPFIYNMHSTSVYTYQPAFKKFRDQIKIVHFLGQIKPWIYNYNTSTGQISSTFTNVHYLPHIQTWWNIFVNEIKPKLPTDLIGSEDKETKINLTNEWDIEKIEGASLISDSDEFDEFDNSNDSDESNESFESDLEKGIAGQLANLEITDQEESYNRKKQWEAGNIDYLGVDKFDNIWKKLEEFVGK